MKRISPYALGAALLVGVLSGCADGTLPELNSINPFQRSQWTEDLKHGPTFHEQLAELEQLEANASRLPAADQQRWSEMLVRIVRDDTSPLLRARAVRALASFPTATAAEGVSAATADTDKNVRVAATKAWGARGGPQAIDALTSLATNDTDVDVRIAAVKELGRFSDPRSVRALGVALNDRDPALQLRVVESLKRVSGRDYGNDLNAWRQYAQGGNPPQPPPPSIAERLQTLF